MIILAYITVKQPRQNNLSNPEAYSEPWQTLRWSVLEK